jgi:hypothetical protein
VSISGPSGSTIYYTTNGKPPTTSSSKYTGPISVSSNEFVQAVAVEPGYTDSLVGSANYQIAPADTPIINFGSGFSSASGLINLTGAAQLSGSAIQLTDANYYKESSAAWYPAPVNVQNFTTDFKVQFTDVMANGMTFTLQNQNPVTTNASNSVVTGGPFAIGSDGGGLGYAGLQNSVAVTLNLTDNGTGIYTNGEVPSGSDTSISGVSLNSGNPLAVSMNYSGTTLKIEITDTKTNASFSKSWTINIPTTVGGNTAYVGFTGGTGFSNAIQKVLSWTYSN